ncbi:AraC family transcriptional regulator [Myxococcus landrumensis]|uniref:Helix-turn-helix transcriptional regulator n=1 Tax=Myxococcus landrumensis TaxID=2813577 RepID=A0ABX7N4P1_9BACT|nr:AraC family transcriptional regulator [Myxococcus landrumus]QSQ13722.1 helix-turn-helix transcriptional regulator [Myxococcus landrumus]
MTTAAWQGVGMVLYWQPQLDAGEHHHSSLQLLMPLGRGGIRGHWRTAGRPVDLRLTCDEVGVVGSDLPHAFAWSGGTQVVSFFLDPRRLASLHGEPSTEDALRRLGPSKLRDPLVRELLRASDEALREDRGPSRIEVETLATVLASRLLRLDGQRHRARSLSGALAPWQVQRVTDFVEAHLEESLGLESLAAVVGLSPSHFSRSFKRETGTTPHQFVLARRLERARELLVTTALPLADIAQRIGVSSQSHFTALFRARFSVTPARFRRAEASPPKRGFTTKRVGTR